MFVHHLKTTVSYSGRDEGCYGNIQKVNITVKPYRPYGMYIHKRMDVSPENFNGAQRKDKFK